MYLLTNETEETGEMIVPILLFLILLVLPGGIDLVFGLIALAWYLFLFCLFLFIVIAIAGAF